MHNIHKMYTVKWIIQFSSNFTTFDFFLRKAPAFNQCATFVQFGVLYLLKSIYQSLLSNLPVDIQYFPKEIQIKWCLWALVLNNCTFKLDGLSEPQNPWKLTRKYNKYIWFHSICIPCHFKSFFFCWFL